MDPRNVQYDRANDKIINVLIKDFAGNDLHLQLNKLEAWQLSQAIEREITVQESIRDTTDWDRVEREQLAFETSAEGMEVLKAYDEVVSNCFPWHRAKHKRIYDLIFNQMLTLHEHEARGSKLGSELGISER